MADVVEKMLAGTQTTFHGDNRHLVAETSRMGVQVEVTDETGRLVHRRSCADAAEGYPDARLTDIDKASQSNRDVSS
jgi:hypothetical protein